MLAPADCSRWARALPSLWLFLQGRDVCLRWLLRLWMGYERAASSSASSGWWLPYLISLTAVLVCSGRFRWLLFRRQRLTPQLSEVGHWCAHLFVLAEATRGLPTAETSMAPVLRMPTPPRLGQTQHDSVRSRRASPIPAGEAILQVESHCCWHVDPLRLCATLLVPTPPRARSSQTFVLPNTWIARAHLPKNLLVAVYASSRGRHAPLCPDPDS